MRVLLDECVPQPLRLEIAGHDVVTAGFLGWKGVKNGELLRRMLAAGLQALITTDQNLPYQQNLQTAGIAVIVLEASSNKLEDLLPLAPKILDALKSINSGQSIIVKS